MRDAKADVRLKRIFSAVALGPVDRVPVVLEASAWCARVVGLTLSAFASGNLTSAQASIDAFHAVGGADAMEYVASDPALLSYGWMSKVKLPGVDLPDDEHWQVQELELLQPDDYERIVDEGWEAFRTAFITERIGPDVVERATTYERDAPSVAEMIDASGILFLVGADVTMPFEYLCGGRSFAKFVYDLYRIPDKVEAAMQSMMEGLSEQSIACAKESGRPGVWVGGWRGASEMLSQPLWDRFVFPYHKQLVQDVVAAGLTPILHLDSDWTRDLARFQEYPARRCVLSLDSRTDIRKAKEVLGDHMCIMGDVPPALLSQGTPDEVYQHSRRLIQDIGPTGYILHSGCDIPADAPLNNVTAMVRAAEDA